MTNFDSYARYYDLLYRDKDYVAEADYVAGLINHHAPGAQAILELGCGTGKHAVELASLGYEVCGIDLSQEMVARAQSYYSQSPATIRSKLSFFHGDMRNLRIEKQFDVVISLFHVMSYQISNEDLKASLSTVRYHLKPGGILIFDCWYGPAVLSERPSVKVKRMEDEKVNIVRIAEPIIHSDKNIVDVNYQVFIIQKESGNVEIFSEKHPLRYLFGPEVDLLLEGSQLKIVEFRKWMSSSHPDLDTWSVYFVCRG